MSTETKHPVVEDFINNYVNDYVVEVTFAALKKELRVALDIKEGKQTCTHPLMDFLGDGEVQCLYCGRTTTLGD